MFKRRWEGQARQRLRPSSPSVSGSAPLCRGGRMFLSVAELRSKTGLPWTFPTSLFLLKLKYCGTLLKTQWLRLLSCLAIFGRGSTKTQQAQPRTLNMPPTYLNGLNTSDAGRVFARPQPPDLTHSHVHLSHCQ